MVSAARELQLGSGLLFAVPIPAAAAAEGAAIQAAIEAALADAEARGIGGAEVCGRQWPAALGAAVGAGGPCRSRR